MEKVQNIFHVNFFRQISIFFILQGTLSCKRTKVCFAHPAGYNFGSTAFVPRASRLLLCELRILPEAFYFTGRNFL